MIRIRDRFAGDPITLYCAETQDDARQIYRWSLRRMVWALDTESTGLNCYKPGWRLRTFQFGDATRSYVLPARFKRTIRRVITRQGVQWIGHNGPHDIRCIDEHLGDGTGVVCEGETYIASHHRDSRNRAEGGVGHELKELGKQLDPRADRWEVELKRVFKTIEIPVPGEVYKSGPRKGQQKIRKARLDEGWSLIDPMHPVYIAYAAVDPIITFRVWQWLRGTVRQTRERYDFDLRVQLACDRLQRRALPLDVPYTERLSRRYRDSANALMAKAAEYGCANIHSGQQVAKTLQRLGVKLTKRTKSGNAYATDSTVLRGLLGDPIAREFILAVLGAKQLIKRRESYTEQMLAEMDSDGRVHPSINTLGARTTRMSVSRPPLQQLPTKDREDELGDSIGQA